MFRTAMMRGAMAACLAVGMMLAPNRAVQAQSVSEAPPQSTLDKIKERGKVLVGCVPELPYAGEDPRTGKWRGFYPLMAADLARELKVEWECVPVTWGNAVLALQSGKVDMIMTLAALPQRAMVVNFAGPVGRQAFMMVTRKGLAGETWEDFNKPEVRVAVQTGSSNELILNQVAPKATKIGLAAGVDPSLAVSSGRADAFLSSTLSGTIARAKNPGVGELVLPTPLVYQEGYVALRYETDQRWHGFLQHWATWNAMNGKVREWVRQGLLDSGVPEDKLPDLRKAGY